MRNLREPRDPREEREQREERQQHDERERLERERAEHEQGRPKLTAVPRPERGITGPERSTVETAEAGVRTGDIHQNEQAKTLLTKRQVEEMRERWQSI